MSPLLQFGTRGDLSKHTIYSWKAKYGGMDVRQAQEAKQHALAELAYFAVDSCHAVPSGGSLVLLLEPKRV